MTPGEEVHRFKLTIHYDGTRFHGWQVQAAQRTVQGEMEAAVERLTQRHRTVLGSGRTDSGVHATGQVASVDVPVRWSPPELRTSMNAVLPRDVWVAAVDAVDPGFHPRFHATARTYEYRLGLADAAASPFQRPWCWALEDPVDLSALREAAALLPGERSFRAFAKSGQPHRGHRCRVRDAAWSEWTGLGMIFRMTADRYLHRMVRYLVGTMVDVARGRRPLEEMASLLDDSESELVTSPPAPPEGLFLVRVEYPPDAEAPRSDPTEALSSRHGHDGTLLEP